MIHLRFLPQRMCALMNEKFLARLPAQELWMNRAVAFLRNVSLLFGEVWLISSPYFLRGSSFGLVYVISHGPVAINSTMVSSSVVQT